MKTNLAKKAGAFVILFDFLLFNSLLAQLPPPNQLPANLDIIILTDVSGKMAYSLDGCNPTPGISNAPGASPNPANNTHPCTWCTSSCPHPNPTWQRMYYVQPGLAVLSTIFNRLYDLIATGGGGVSSIRFAIGRFPGQSPNDITWLEQNTASNFNLRPYDATELGNILNVLTLQSTGGTPIGTAIQTPYGAIQKFNNHRYGDAGSTGSMIILVTAGKQYGGQLIYDSSYGPGSGWNHVAFRGWIDPSSTPRPCNIKIVSLGFGDLSGVESDFAMLSDISRYFQNYNSSLTSEIFTKLAINTAFSSIWNRTLSITDPSYLIQPDSIQQHPAYITIYDDRLLLVLSWQNPRLDKTLQFTMRTAMGLLITPQLAQQHPDIDFDFGPTFQMYTVQKPFLQQHLGRWELLIDAKDIEQPEWYAISILGHSSLQLRDLTKPTEQPQFTGDSLLLSVSLTANEIPITNANIKAKITGPEKGAGNWFHDFPLTPTQFDSVKLLPLPDPVDNVDKKAYYMRHVRGVPLPGTKSFEISLQYNSQDDLYHGKTPSLTIPGIYNVEVFTIPDTAISGNFFTRSLILNYFIKLRPNLDWTHSLLAFTKVGEGIGPGGVFDVYQAQFTPKDKFLNFLKPGKTQNIKLMIENAELEGSVVDSLNGSYYQRIRVARNAVGPTVQIQYDDFVFNKRNIP
jgi:hypothetical protein